MASEVVRQMAKFTFTNTDFMRLEIECAVPSRRSQRLAERVGATREGILRNRLQLHDRAVDAVMYSLIRLA